MDELNQVFQDEENIFEDSETEAEETTETEVPEEPFLTIRYNKEDKGLSRDEAVTYAQKGMNYDHLNGKYTNLTKRLENLAGMNGMQLEDYLNSLSDAQMNLAIAQEVQKLRSTYPDAQDELLRQLAEKNVGERFPTKEEEPQEEVNKDLERQLNIFNQVHPGVRADNLDDRVYDLMSEGYTLLEAYTIVNKPKLEAQNSIQRKNESNKSKSLGNVGNNENISTDDFLNGFLNG